MERITTSLPGNDRAWTAPLLHKLARLRYCESNDLAMSRRLPQVVLFSYIVLVAASFITSNFFKSHPHMTTKFFP